MKTQLHCRTIDSDNCSFAVLPARFRKLSAKTAPPPIARLATLALLMALAFLAGGFGASAATSTPPNLMTYQGFLVDVNGVALATNTPANYPINFRIYDASTGGNLLWSEQQVVTVDKGNFSVILGQGTPVSGEPNPTLSTAFIGVTASDRYIDITVTISGTANVISPRLRLLPSPYAFTASTALSLNAQGTNLLGGNPLFFNTASDVNNGLGYVSQFGGVTIGGPAVFGSGGGVLGSVANATNQTAALLWNSTGQVGIGTGTNRLAATAKLEVAGGIRIDGNNTLEFGGGVAKDTNSPPLNGTIAYKRYSNGLDIVGAGVGNTDRLISIFADGGCTFHGAVFNMQMSTGSGVLYNTPLEFGLGLNGKEQNAGKIGYGTFDNALDIVGAGTAYPNRVINLQDRVGIGTATPRCALDVENFSTVSEGTYGYLNAGGNVGFFNASGTPFVSIYAAQRILCPEFNATSDSRIKKIVGVSDNRRDLETIQKLKVTDYHMIDWVAGGNGLKKGFIAQEVKAIIPEAVSTTTNFIPDIFSLPSTFEFDGAARTLSVTMTNAHGLKAGDRVRIITEGKRLEVNVTEVPSAERFVVAVEKSETQPKKLFVYGKEVPDLHDVNYDRIFTTGIGAIQELARRVEKLETREARLAELEKKAAKLETLETEVAELRKLVGRLAASAAKATPVTVAAAAPAEAPSTASSSVGQ